MRTQEILEALSADGSVLIAINRSEGFERDSCTVELDFHPFIKQVGETVFEAAFKVAKELADYPGTPIRVREALKAYDRRTETLI